MRKLSSAIQTDVADVHDEQHTSLVAELLARSDPARNPVLRHALLAERCRCREPLIAEDMYGDVRCALCGRLPR